MEYEEDSYGSSIYTRWKIKNNYKNILKLNQTI